MSRYSHLTAAPKKRPIMVGEKIWWYGESPRPFIGVIAREEDYEWVVHLNNKTITRVNKQEKLYRFVS